MKINQALEKAAHRLARYNVDAEPAIREIYLFPARNEIRLIELDPTMMPSDEITPFYFGPDPESGIPFPSGIALILPQERRRLRPPDGWGPWTKARRIWPDGKPRKNPSAKERNGS